MMMSFDEASRSPEVLISCFIRGVDKGAKEGSIVRDKKRSLVVREIKRQIGITNRCSGGMKIVGKVSKATSRR
jgi:hypothetical protein